MFVVEKNPRCGYLCVFVSWVFTWKEDARCSETQAGPSAVSEGAQDAARPGPLRYSVLCCMPSSAHSLPCSLFIDFDYFLSFSPSWNFSPNTSILQFQAHFNSMHSFGPEPAPIEYTAHSTAYVAYLMFVCRFVVLSCILPTWTRVAFGLGVDCYGGYDSLNMLTEHEPWFQSPYRWVWCQSNVCDYDHFEPLDGELGCWAVGYWRHESLLQTESLLAW